MRAIRGKICTSETSLHVNGKILWKGAKPLQHVKNKTMIFRSLFISFYLVKLLQASSTCSFAALSLQDIFYSVSYNKRSSSKRVSHTISSLKASISIAVPAFPSPSAFFSVFFLTTFLSPPLMFPFSAKAVLRPGSWLMGVFLSFSDTDCLCGLEVLLSNKASTRVVSCGQQVLTPTVLLCG